MPNPLFQQLSQNNGNGFNNPFQMIQKFNEFRQNFTGDPKQMVEQLLQSGRMSQQDFNKYSQMASEFQKLVK